MAPAPLRRLAVLFAIVGAAAVLEAAWRQGWTYDEPIHLRYSRRLLEAGVTERESLVFFDSKTPIILPNVVLQKLGEALGAKGPGAQRFLARVPGAAWYLALVFLTFRLAKRLGGETAGCLAASLVALDPNVIAHSSVATVDAAYAAATVLTVSSYLRLSRGPSLRAASGLGLALGLAFTAKFSAVLLLPGFLFVPLGAPRAERSRWLRLAGLSIVAGLVACFAISASYLFVSVARPFGAMQFQSCIPRALASRAGWLRLPLPEAFLTGLDLSLAHERETRWDCILLDRYFPGGVWFYFLALWALKTPAALFCAQLAGAFRALRARLWMSREMVFVGFVFVLHMGYFSLLFRAQTGYRYVLMCLPLADAFAAAGLSSWMPRARAWLGAAAVLTLAELAPYWGQPLAFVNALVWRKERAFHYVADSNLDWNQNADEIQGLLQKHGVAATHLQPLHLLPGHNTFSASVLGGVDAFEQHRWLRAHAEPSGHYAYTWIWYEVDPDLFDRFLDESRRVHPTAAGADLCRGSAFEEPGGGFEAGASGRACLEADKVADVRLIVSRGSIEFGPFEGGRCRGEVVAAGQQSWWRLEPGVHAFCAVAAGGPLDAHLEGAGVRTASGPGGASRRR